MTNINVSLNEDLKENADLLFESLGLDTETAIRMFLTAALEYEGLPFEIRHRGLGEGLRQAVSDTINHENLYGPYDSADEAVKAMLED